jgi:hypothetical protein
MGLQTAKERASEAWNGALKLPIMEAVPGMESRTFICSTSVGMAGVSLTGAEQFVLISAAPATGALGFAQVVVLPVSGSTTTRSSFSGRDNLASLVQRGKSIDHNALEAARSALKRLDSRVGEDVEAWAGTLASDLGSFKD